MVCEWASSDKPKLAKPTPKEEMTCLLSMIVSIDFIFLKNKYTMPRSLSQPRVIISREIKDTANLEPLYFL